MTWFFENLTATPQELVLTFAACVALGLCLRQIDRLWPWHKGGNGTPSI